MMKKLITVLILAIFLNIVAGYSFSSTPLFEDDFDYFDATKWYNYNGGHFGSVTVRDHLIIDKNCLSFENGTAVIKICYNKTDDCFHSYYMESYQEMGYGIYEARMRFTLTPYCNFAFWLYSPRDKHRSYFDNSEIDWESSYIHGMAYIRTNYWYSDLFNGKPWSGFQISHKESDLNISRLDWHVYKIEYTPTYIKWYIDDKLVRTAPGNMTVVAYNTIVKESPENLTKSDTLRIFFAIGIIMSYNASADGEYIDKLYVNPSLKSENFSGYLYIDWVKYYPLEGYVNYTHYIDRLPYDIRKPGVYVLAKNLSYNGNSPSISIYVNNVVIDGKGNTLEGNPSCSAIYSSVQRNITIKNLKLKNWNIGIELRHINNAKIENVSVEDAKYAVLLWRISDGKVNSVKAHNYLEGVYVVYSDNVSLSNITLKNGHRGVYMCNVSKSSLSNFEGSNNKYNIGVRYSNNLTMENITGYDSFRIIMVAKNSKWVDIKNVFARCSDIGIYLSGDSIILNNASVMSKYGVVAKLAKNIKILNLSCFSDYDVIIASSKNITIADSYLTHNSTGWGCGIRVRGSSSVIATKNTIINKPSAFYIDENSVNNQIYLNNFINDRYKYCKNPNNFFRTPEIVSYKFNGTTFNRHLGNYWSKYSGTDNDGDGIGDKPYSVYSGCYDESPLIAPVENYDLS